MTLSGSELSSAQQFLMFLDMSFNFSEFGQKLVVLQYFEIFDMEISFVIASVLFLWLTWVHTLKNTQSSEVIKTDLHFTDGI